MWCDLSIQWKTAFEEAWRAFCTGNIPIGAALFDENGEQQIVTLLRGGEVLP